MNFKLQSAAALMLAVSLVPSSAMAVTPVVAKKKHVVVKKTTAPAGPTVEEQLKALRAALDKQAGQIDGLKNGLAEKDAQLKQAEQAAASAQAAATKAQEAASVQQQAVTENANAVSTLEATVTDMKSANASIVSELSDTTAKAAKKSELSDIAFGKVKITGTVFADFSYWSDYDGATSFIDNQTKPSSTADGNYNAFEITRTYVNFLYTPSDAVSVRITPDIYRTSAVTGVTSTVSKCTALPCTPTVTNTYTTDQNLTFRLKYGYVELNKLFANIKYIKTGKVTFGQTQNPLTDWEEGLTGHRYTYKMPMDFASGLSSTYVGVKARLPYVVNGKTYVDTDFGIYTNGAYSTTELSGTKQFMGRTTVYPLGTKAERTGLGLTLFGNVGFTNVAPNSAVAGHYTLDRMAIMGHYQTADKAYLITGQYNLSHNIKNNANTQEGYAFEGNARLGGKKSPFHAFGLYQYYEPFSNASNNNATKFSRTVGGIAYKFNKNLDISFGDSNYHYDKAAGKNDANVVSVFTQYVF